MKRLIAAAGALVLSVGAYAGQADQPQQPVQQPQQASSEPVQMTDAQLDSVAAGLITIAVVDAVDIEDNQVQVAVPVNAAVAAGVLGTAGAGAAQLGNITQRR